MTLFGVTVCVGVAIVLGLSTVALLKLEINGPIENRIEAGKDLIGDILPPPEYVIEAYLEANLASRDAGGLAQHKARLAQLHRDYDERRAYWAKSILPNDIKAELVDQSNADVQVFWRGVEGDLLPALERGDKAAADSAMSEITTAYMSHRKTIDDIVSKTNAANDSLTQEAKADLKGYQALMFGGAGVVLAVILAGIALMQKRVVQPIKTMTQYMSGLAAGDYDKEVPLQARRDEIGGMAQSVGVFREAVLERRRARIEQETERETAEQSRIEDLARTQRSDTERSAAVRQLAGGLQRLSSKDLDCELIEPFPELYEELRVDFNATVKSLRAIMTSVVGSAQSVTASAGEIAKATEDLSRRTEQQAASLEQTAAALDEITATVRQTSAAADECHSAISNAMSMAEQSETVVEAAMTAMGGIESSSKQISQIIGVIDEIAFQTNLLALNAGVEAARAGDAGRGFAVVAQEVRALAQRSADAARGIKTLISASSGQVNQGVGLVLKTSETLKAIVEQVGTINGLVGGIAGSAREQASTLHEVNHAINAMDQVTQQNAAMVEQASAAGEELSGEAADLHRLVGGFIMAGQSGGGLRRAA
jgi:methyl-accepting chemotaxis protein